LGQSGEKLSRGYFLGEKSSANRGSEICISKRNSQWGRGDLGAAGGHGLLHKGYPGVIVALWLQLGITGIFEVVIISGDTPRALRGAASRKEIQKKEEHQVIMWFSSKGLMPGRSIGATLMGEGGVGSTMKSLNSTPHSADLIWREIKRLCI